VKQYGRARSRSVQPHSLASLTSISFTQTNAGYNQSSFIGINVQHRFKYFISMVVGKYLGKYELRFIFKSSDPEIKPRVSPYFEDEL
jgi:hypothetical protein